MEGMTMIERNALFGAVSIFNKTMIYTIHVYEFELNWAKLRRWYSIPYINPIKFQNQWSMTSWFNYYITYTQSYKKNSNKWKMVLMWESYELIGYVHYMYFVLK